LHTIMRQAGTPDLASINKDTVVAEALMGYAKHRS